MASSKHHDAKPLRSTQYLPKAGPKSASGGRNKRQPTKNTSGAGTYYMELEREKQIKREAAAAERRQTFIELVASIAASARTIADSLENANDSDMVGIIVEETISLYYTTSLKSTSNKPADFMEVKNEVMKLHEQQLNEKMGVVKFATYRALDALNGGYRMTKFGLDLDTVLVQIKKRHDDRKQRAAGNRQLVSA